MKGAHCKGIGVKGNAAVSRARVCYRRLRKKGQYYAADKSARACTVEQVGVQFELLELWKLPEATCRRLAIFDLPTLGFLELRIPTQRLYGCACNHPPQMMQAGWPQDSAFWLIVILIEKDQPKDHRADNQQGVNYSAR